MNERTIVTADVALPALMRATLFAAEKHRGQRRKDVDKTPYINHPIMVVNLLANVGRITDLETLQAGMLHDKSLEKPERKRLQIEHAPHLSPRAKCIKIADKIANLTDLLNAPPATWPEERLRQYVVWSRQVVAGCRGQNRSLEVRYDEVAGAF